MHTPKILSIHESLCVRHKFLPGVVQCRDVRAFKLFLFTSLVSTNAYKLNTNSCPIIISIDIFQTLFTEAMFYKKLLLLISTLYVGGTASSLPSSLGQGETDRGIIIRNLAKPRFFGAAANTNFLFKDENYTKIISKQVNILPHSLCSLMVDYIKL